MGIPDEARKASCVDVVHFDESWSYLSSYYCLDGEWLVE